jgi:hypothetical protein
MADKEYYIKEIQQLIGIAEQFSEMDFRMKMEAIIKQGGKESEYALIPFLTDTSIDNRLRKNIIRVAGYISNPIFLIPLKHIIEGDENPFVQQEAIISVSKFNDQRALNILNTALQNINNQLLLSTLNNEISKIKQNNPVLTLLPKFLNGDNNPKDLKIAIDIFKRILSPQEATAIAKYLTHESPVIAQGAFEVVCHTGSLSHLDTLIDFYTTHIKQAMGTDDTEFDAIYLLTVSMVHYLERFPEHITTVYPHLTIYLKMIPDLRVKSLLINILCKVNPADILEILHDLYQQYPKLKETIIEGLSGKDDGFEFLFAKLNSESYLKETIVAALLKSQKGADYFIDHFFEFDLDFQEIVISKLPNTTTPKLMILIKKIFTSELFILKQILLEWMKSNYVFDSKSILFDPARDREFQSMGNDYFSAICQLFPISTIFYTFEQLAYKDLSISKAKKILSALEPIIDCEPVLKFANADMIENTINKILGLNSIELRSLLLILLSKIHLNDLNSQHILSKSLNLFISDKGRKLTPKENNDYFALKENLNHQFYEISKKEEELVKLKNLFENPYLDLNAMENFITAHHQVVIREFRPIIRYLEEQLLKIRRESIFKVCDFLKKFPMISVHLKDFFINRFQPEDPFIKNEILLALETISALTKDISVFIQFSNKNYVSLLYEQIALLFPEIIINPHRDINSSDYIICDSTFLKNEVLIKKITPRRIILYLENPSDISPFKELNPKTIVKPFSLNRFYREIIKDLYL